MFLPFMGLWILIDRKAGRIGHRFITAAVFGAGFLIAIAPFTIRNWVVSGKPVLLVDGAINLPLYITPPGAPKAAFAYGAGGLTGTGGALLMCIRYFLAHPVLTVMTELRKVGFTFGLPGLGPADGVNPPWHFILYPILFAFAIWMRRVPRNFLSVTAVFLLSHLTAMVAAAPWTYGYKTIIPFHLSMLVGLAFLIPRHRRERPATRLVDVGTASVFPVVLTPGLESPALQRALAESDARFILFDASGRALPADVQKLLAYAGEFEVVDGIGGEPFRVRWPNWIVAKYAGAPYDELTLADATGGLRLIRRDIAEMLATDLTNDGESAGLEMTLMILSRNISLIQVPVSTPSTRMSGAEAIRAIVRASLIYRRERGRSDGRRHSATSVTAEPLPQT
jgi:hypothetical protein